MEHSDRKLVRKNKRLKVRFGIEGPTRAAFTGNTSTSGVHILTNMPEQPGTRVQVSVILPDGQEVLADGIVCWAKRVPVNLMRLTTFAGMGVRFTRFHSGQQAYEDFVEALRF